MSDRFSSQPPSSEAEETLQPLEAPLHRAPVLNSSKDEGLGRGPTPADIVARISSSRRYRWVADEVIKRLAVEEIPKSRNLAEAEKRTKRRLHQIFGAYTAQPDYGRLLEQLSAAWQGEFDEVFLSLCRKAMSQHASTRERLPILDDFYAHIFAVICRQVQDRPSSVVDIACGLNPLAAPWMSLPPGSHYVAYDIDRQLVGFVGDFLDLIGLSHRAELRDIVSAPPDDICDVALLLKSVPCLDQQDPDGALRIVRTIRARYIVVSFPTQSLGGRGKGMARNYRERFDDLIEQLAPECGLIGEIELPGELVFVLGRDRG